MSPSVMDLVRFSTDSRAHGAGTMDLSADTRDKFFSLDGGTTKIASFSTGVVSGDGRQASHWKDNLGLGIMDPTAAPGEQLLISANDKQLMDAIGWNVTSTWKWINPAGATFSAGAQWSSRQSPRRSRRVEMAESGSAAASSRR